MAEKKTPAENLAELKASWAKLKGTVSTGKQDIKKTWNDSWEGKK